MLNRKTRYEQGFSRKSLNFSKPKCYSKQKKNRKLEGNTVRFESVLKCKELLYETSEVGANLTKPRTGTEYNNRR